MHYPIKSIAIINLLEQGYSGFDLFKSKRKSGLECGLCERYAGPQMAL